MSNFIGKIFDRSPQPLRPGRVGRRPWTALILPQQCALCAGAAGPAVLCDGCDDSLPRLPLACPRCALPTRCGELCVDCLRRPPPFAAARAAYAYAWPADHLLHELKYRGALELAPFFAQAIARQGPADVDLLVAIPLAHGRQRQRGFNQATEIARHLARETGIPMVAALARVRETGTQVGLSAAQRMRNLHGAFAGTRVLAGRRVALVDDVMTTGATMRAAAREVLRAGALSVEAWVAARTLTRNPD